MRRLAALTVLTLMLVAAAQAQVPQPFPRPQNPQPPVRPVPAAPQPPTSTPAQPPPSVPPRTAPEQDQAPTETVLGLPIYPNAQFVASYDAGHGQRYYLFGSEAAFSVLVKYYQSVLKTKGTLVFEEPATQMFEVGRFDEKTMAFPPGVTVKDYTWNGGAGYLNPKRDGKPERFATIIQFVPVPPTAAR